MTVRLSLEKRNLRQRWQVWSVVAASGCSRNREEAHVAGAVSRVESGTDEMGDSGRAR